MTYSTVLDSFKSMIESQYKLDCFEKTYSAGSPSDEEPVVKSNPAYALLETWAKNFDSVKEKIFSGLDCLFNDPDEEYAVEDTNFQIINGYADGSKTFQKYSIDTEEFTEIPYYFYVRGNLYDMLPRANLGEYVNAYYDNVKNVTEICKYYNELYEDYIEPPVSGDDGTSTISKLEYFWNEYYSEFEEKVNNKLNDILVIGDDYYNIITFIRNYKSLFLECSTALGKIDNFISSLNKTINAPNTRLYDSYSKISSSGFSMYSSSLGEYFDLFLESISIRYNSKYSSNDEYNQYLRKIYTSLILTKKDYFNKSLSMLNWVEDFRKKYNI